ncbi:HEXXH motif domain-containing protein [Streptomyces pseudovenezuelae]|uniref:HEXXH motif-containing protein n=1 Tax=Streptomyces pseudovenezuelae TaxID=67350 RepID=A0ABT6LHJ9_9ACTN|nr:HEXXH motif domain-containing protein [Streptomyces pseudovenezuelae]MDH6214844.1 HEXXH motif-containing protein [Streptomyces pseudovenezuelae]
MAADATTASNRLPFHRLSAVGALALARGEGDAAAVGELLGAERSRRLLLLRALDAGLARGDLPEEGTTMPYAEAWELLERVQRQAPEVFESVLMAPTTGMWVSLTLRRIRGRSYEDAPLWVVAGHLTALAAAAGIRAGLDFEITVPVRRGLVPLPTLGCARLPVSEPWSRARVVADAGRVRIQSTNGEVEIDPVRDGRGPAWVPVRRLRLGTGPSAKELVLDELDPYRTFPRPSEPRLLSAAEAVEWESLLAGAWEILLRDEPVSAEAMRLGLMVVAPTPTRERFRPYSGTAGDAFGGVTASRPDDPAQLAATLMHEFQHTKLGGLMHLGTLSEPVTEGRLFYAPWRDDPRPLGGLMQGIYAFHGVTRFWRTHRHAADAFYAPLAHFEFALWRTQVWATLSEVRDCEGLTPLGRRVLEHLGECLEGWLADEVPATELRLAEEAAADHRARWRAHHLRPPAHAVEQAAQAWHRGDNRPPAELQDASPSVVPDTEVRLLDGAAVLARYVLTDPDGDWRHFAGAGGVEGADDADVLLACGDRAAAYAAFTARLSAKGAPVAAWVGLGRSLPPDQAPAARLLLRFPERARAVQDAVQAMTGRGADPVRLAAWLAEGDRTRRRSV